MILFCSSSSTNLPLICINLFENKKHFVISSEKQSKLAMMKVQMSGQSTFLRVVPIHLDEALELVRKSEGLLLADVSLHVAQDLLQVHFHLEAASQGAAVDLRVYFDDESQQKVKQNKLEGLHLLFLDSQTVDLGVLEVEDHSIHDLEDVPQVRVPLAPRYRRLQSTPVHSENLLLKDSVILQQFAVIALEHEGLNIQIDIWPVKVIFVVFQHVEHI